MARYSSKSWRAFQPDAASARAGSPPANDLLRVVPAQASALQRRVLGLDPGSQRTGFGIVDVTAANVVCVAHGCINVVGAAFFARLRAIHCQVAELVAAHHPDEVAVERVFVSRNVDSALKLGQARGAALAAVPASVGVFEYAPRAVKLAASGFGGADKQQVAHMIGQLLSLREALLPDASDALAVALCHAHAMQSAARLATVVPG